MAKKSRERIEIERRIAELTDSERAHRDEATRLEELADAEDMKILELYEILDAAQAKTPDPEAEAETTDEE